MVEDTVETGTSLSRVSDAELLKRFWGEVGQVVVQRVT
jgi:hypothetical protein